MLAGALLVGLGGIGAAVAVGTRLGAAEAERARPRVRWTYMTREDVQVLAADGTRVYAGSADATVHAVDATGGRPQWTHALDGLVGALVLAGPAVVVSDGTRTYALDAGTGERRWEQDGALLAAGAGGVLVEGFDFTTGGEQRVVRRLDLGTGAELWRRLQRDLGLAAGPHGVVTSDAVHLTGHGRLLTLDAATGEQLWERPLVEGPVPATVAALSGDTLYAGDHSEPDVTRVVALDPRSGAERWQGLHGAGLAELTVDQDAVYAAGGDRVTAWDATSGRVALDVDRRGGDRHRRRRWRHEPGPARRGGRPGARRRRHLVSPDARQSSVIALDAGTSLWQVDLPPAPPLARRAGPVVAPDGPVVTAVGTTLYAITAG